MATTTKNPKEISEFISNFARTVTPCFETTKHLFLMVLQQQDFPETCVLHTLKLIPCGTDYWDCCCGGLGLKVWNCDGELTYSTYTLED